MPAFTNDSPKVVSCAMNGPLSEEGALERTICDGVCLAGPLQTS